MRSLLLVHVNETPEAAHPAHVVAIALSPNGTIYWGNATCISKKCNTPEAWNAEINRLVALLNELRHTGLSKLQANGSRVTSPGRFRQKSVKRKRTKR